MTKQLTHTAEHEIPVRGYFFNRAERIPESREVGQGEAFLSPFNVPTAVRITVPRTLERLELQLQFANSEPTEREPRGTHHESVQLFLGKNSKKVIEVRLPWSKDFFERRVVPQVSSDSIAIIAPTLNGAQRFVFERSVMLTNLVLRESWNTIVDQIEKFLSSADKDSETSGSA